ACPTRSDLGLRCRHAIDSVPYPPSGNRQLPLQTADCRPQTDLLPAACQIATIRAMTIFERIIAGEIPAKIAYQDDQCIAIHDINPQAPVHLLVIPRKVIPTLNDLTEADAPLVGHLFVVAKKLMNDLG